ncbi:hypothetical protein B0T24DRAFT_685586 [Lasiosphaeria ovina]|uniref:Uncharacterized protein n=1 Tax=Lasiosphaeria ovina TaxID=92902 RepID=A0AAE0JRA3_9PEZI|nr:hypothetical protein B0T24DRAFT_685586 [Lasiosphaeria ovina]
MIAMALFDSIHTIPRALSWAFDFITLSGRDSGDVRWAVAIIVICFVRMLLLPVVGWLAFYFRIAQKFDEPEDLMVDLGGLAAVSSMQLGLAMPPWLAVGRREWANVLRAAGYADDADSVVTYWIFGAVTVGIWALIALYGASLPLCVLFRLAYLFFRHQAHEDAPRDLESGGDPSVDDSGFTLEDQNGDNKIGG